MNGIHDVESMANPIEEIRVPEGDVLRASIHLGADVLKYDLAWYDTELAIVDRHDRAMTTTVFAAAARFGVTDNPTVSRWHLKRNILVQGRQVAAVRHTEVESRLSSFLDRLRALCAVTHKIEQCLLEFTAQDMFHAECVQD